MTKKVSRLMDLNFPVKVLFKCRKREGKEGSRCDNCGMNHKVTEELLCDFIEARKKYIITILRKENRIEARAELTGALNKIKRFLKNIS